MLIMGLGVVNEILSDTLEASIVVVDVVVVDVVVVVVFVALVVLVI